MTALLSDVRNFRRVDDRLLTAGQPSEAQLADASRQGVRVVINLALHDDPRYSLADEAGCVRGLGMEYVNIPVNFNAPTEENLRAFIAAMDAYKSEKILVHCAANYRVTAFVGLYRVVCDGLAVDKAFETMRSVWEPNAVVEHFLSVTLKQHSRTLG